MKALFRPDVNSDVSVQLPVLARDELVVQRVHAVQFPGLPRLGQHVKPAEKGEGGEGRMKY